MYGVFLARYIVYLIFVKLIIIPSLATLISKFPTLHRTLVPQITSMILPFLAGSFPPVHPSSLTQAAAHLLAAMHHIEGKVGGVLAWRNMLDSVLYEAWKCINLLQSSLVKGKFEHRQCNGMTEPL